MDITFVANDTRGGIEPYLALAEEAVSRGHVVRALAPAPDGPAFVAAGARFSALAGAELGRQAAADGPMGVAKMGRLVADHTRHWAITAREAAAGTDVIVAGIGGQSVAGPAAEALHLPYLRAHLQPLTAPSTMYPGPLAPWLAGGGPAARRFSHVVTDAGVRALTRGPESLERALTAALGDDAMKAAARELGAHLSAETGARSAIDEIEAVMAARR